MTASPLSTPGDSLSRMRTIVPHLATAEDMQQCEELLGAIDPLVDFAASVEAQAILATFLLESREGTRGQNVARAFGIYRQMLSTDLRHPLPEAWEAAVIGIANCLIAEPNASLDAYEAAVRLLDQLVEHLRGGDPERLAVALGSYAQLLQSAHTGDRDENLARALALLQEAIAGLGDGERYPMRWSRAHHNLGTLYASLRLGDRSQNVDDAIRALGVALEWRPRNIDPVGRARTLRALASLLPEWSGADSYDEALVSAEACAREADEIAGVDPRAAPRPAAWGLLAGKQTALNGDLDDLLGTEPEAARARLELEIAHHRSVVGALSPDRERLQWAEWSGGLGRLLTRLAHVDHSAEAGNEAYDRLRQAIYAVPAASSPRLARDLYRAAGELGHQYALWDISYPAYSSALSISNFLFDEVATPDSRRQELVEARGFAQFAAYGAARVGNAEEAIRLAEASRSRSLIETMAANAFLAGHAPPEVRESLMTASSRVAALETELRSIEERDPRAVMRKMHRRLAEAVGADPEWIKHRLTDPGALSTNVIEDYVRVTPQLRAARTALRQALQAARDGPAGARVESLDAQGIRAVAASIGRPLVYLMATTWGSVALIVPPSADIVTLRFDDATSGFTRALLHASEDASYERSANRGDVQELTRALPPIIDALAGAVIHPLANRLMEMGHDRAILVPLGTLGQLPLHAAAPQGFSLGYATSARALQAVLLSRTCGDRRSLLAVGNPRRTDEPSLPLATAEVRVIAGMRQKWSTASLFLGGEVRAQALASEAASVTHLHFAGHGIFRPFEPLESALLLADQDSLSLADLLAGKVSFASARLAVMCACRSANVGDQVLPDEMLGLPTGMLLAGVPGVVGTMWPVEERASAIFSVRFYEELFSCDDPLAAVAATQRWLRDASAEALTACVEAMRKSLVPSDEAVEKALSRLWRDLASRSPDERPFGAPVYWAAFAYVGA
ncbi:CHAT domain-containing protein [Paraburkholderia sp.]|uniref:CHAT domain-containing protein n=1 Tax=Paraburkholderia sp. TaxID=1926495 RepID=UPI003C7A7F72